MPSPAVVLDSPEDEILLRALQVRAIGYFLENQKPGGMVADRQRNHGPTLDAGMCSLAATGMGLIAIALASADPYGLISRAEAIARVEAALRAAWDRLPHDHGMLPHFVDDRSSRPLGLDTFSTVDSSWFFAGALWAADFLNDPGLVDLAGRIYKRVDWIYWSRPWNSTRPGLIRHGKGPTGKFLRSDWDRANGETVMMYVLGAGAEDGRALPANSWRSTRPFYGELAGYRFNNADLGLFVFQYGLDLLDLRRWRSPCGLDLAAEAATATTANREHCRARSDEFRTYRVHWGLSAGDGPGRKPGMGAYESYAPYGPMDGTAHLTSALTSIAHRPAEVLENLRAALQLRISPLGRYGLSCINHEARAWVAPDMVGIDAGALVLALENVLMEDRVRSVFHGLPCVSRGLNRLNFRDATAVRRAS
ncbi:glucoamylase family protein [Tundrisphaera lichenicola]|uniref:glucoamylase family protein n=1 Tax=Tundrisphaera lichenicola TaxID=2029860 RepID=UPI003EB93711